MIVSLDYAEPSLTGFFINVERCKHFKSANAYDSDLVENNIDRMTQKNDH